MIATALALLRVVPLRGWLIIGAIIAALAGALYFRQHFINQGVERERVQQNQINQEKHDAATKADSDARLCAADPTCRMRPDQYLRR